MSFEGNEKMKPAAAKSLRLQDVTYRTESGAKITVRASELKLQVEALAKCNGWKAEELLANEPVLPGKRLGCKLVERVPQGWEYDRHSGYIMMRFKGACTPRGQSFCGGAAAARDTDYKPRRSRSGGANAAAPPQKRASPAPPAAPPATPRASRRQRTAVSSYAEVSPPSGRAIGCTQPLLERWRRWSSRRLRPLHERRHSGAGTRALAVQRGGAGGGAGSTISAAGSG